MAKHKQERQPSYWWLKLILVIALIGVIYLLVTKQTTLLIEIGIAIVATFILYFVIRHFLSNRGYELVKPQTISARPQKAQTNNGNGNVVDTSKISTNTLIEELTSRGKIN